MADRMRIYVDTSVFGGAFDPEFARASNALMDQIRDGRLQLVVSGVVEDEISRAPERVQDLFDDMVGFAELIRSSGDALELHEAYLRAQVVTQKWAADALHVALATVALCPLLASWNFRHIVHFQKAPLYNAINAVRGYAAVMICSPPEVLNYAKEEGIRLR
jgi:predicted nucleic acid-binding protein